ncbi:MAG: bifunctional methylenetetrahydrofolate dehydrogenase/methenyltetrahydrofolate cyclohydrolase [Acholeplasmatales bacterium]|nr:bifunctional methylenetetrahydrofolate dehydrogenase/methenyltetrahydrofolate cyclohydrolase [Acholeplasmatales bacterium]
MGIVISGKDLALKIKDGIKEELSNIKDKRLPKLAVIIVGNDPASQSYVKGKSKACEYCGIINQTIQLSETITEEELLAEIDKLNADDTVDGILVQLPLPRHLNEQRCIERVSANKDVDGFHPINVAGLYTKKDCIKPCTPKGIIKLIDEANVTLDGARAVVIGRSQIVGEPVAKLLQDRNATVTICHSHTKNLKEICKQADVLVVAIGSARKIDASYVKPNACVIDVGVNRDKETGKLCGDCDFDSVNEVASILTKVPGGVGPMTIACLMENTMELYKKHISK